MNNVVIDNHHGNYSIYGNRRCICGGDTVGCLHDYQEEKQEGKMNMERLTTRWCPKGYDTFDPIDIVNNEYSKANFEKILQKLGEYEDAEEEGLLHRIPLRIGDEAWCIRWYHDVRRIKNGIVTDMFYTKDMKLMIVVGYVGRGLFGEKIFHTQEEAEAALKRMKGEEHE